MVYKFNKLHQIMIWLYFSIFIFSCQTIYDKQLENFGRIDSATYPGRKLEKKSLILIEKIISKSQSFVGTPTIAFQENLRFQLLEKGFSVELNQNEIVSKDPASSPLAVSNDSGITNVSRISPSTIEYCRKIGCDLIINGILIETKTGNILDEKTSSGILLYASNSDGLLNSEFRYTGDRSIDSIQTNVILAKLFAEKITSVYNTGNTEKGFFKKLIPSS
ncbi:hypothetical protein [Leptospira sp. 'Mane']|uniref:hypothetical protein n=1 Tax=Leptospira sp. 'Mane' TaxID=3387407 RepID=UPI00398AB032